MNDLKHAITSELLAPAMLHDPGMLQASPLGPMLRVLVDQGILLS